MPGRSSQVILRLLRDYECRNVTYVDPAGDWPIVWTRARGCHVWDAEGRRYLDLTAAFGVAAAGHANPRVVRAGQRQMARLLHAMGDVHPHPLKACLARALSRITFERWTCPNRRVACESLRPPGAGETGPETADVRAPLRARTLFANSGFEAVEAALKTALLATGRPGVVAFEGAYHGLGYGALNATQREYFRGPFRPQLREFAVFAPYPERPEALASALDAVDRALCRGDVGAVLVEPAQARGGIRFPVPGFLSALRRQCDAHGALLILDEIYTGFGRTGRWFACEHEAVVPDLLCVGKALAGGFPLSACVGRADLMDRAWPPATGEAIHTSTFLGHPVGCAMALAQIAELRRRRLIQRAARLGRVLQQELARLPATLNGLRVAARGRGLMAGLELTRADGAPATDACLRAVKDLLHRGFILLPEGAHSHVIGLTPPLTVSERDLRRAVAALGQTLRRLPAA